MATIIGDISQIDNKGEQVFFSALESYLDDSYVVYWNRELYGREFDVCILIPDIGICVVEVKGWHEDTVLEVPQGETILINTIYGPQTHNPRKQARAYRYSVANHIRSRLGKQPAVFHMVCYPFIKNKVFLEKQMDLVSEPEITFLAEDLLDQSSFLRKLNSAIELNRYSGRNQFTHELMGQVRGLFEPIFLSRSEISIYDLNEENLYSITGYITTNDLEWQDKIDLIIKNYLEGCKIILATNSVEIYEQAVFSIGKALRELNIRPNKQGDLELEQLSENYAECRNNFFNWHLDILPDAPDTMSDFYVINGQINDSQSANYLNVFKEKGILNLEQYFIEHSDVNKNIVVTAGAGTGKTHVMISRIAYLCYKEKINASTINDLIVMLTFTNEAADNMRKRLKKHFRNHYLLTGNMDFLKLIAQIDRMSISTIDSYAKKLIDQLGIVKGYGSDPTISSGSYDRKQLIAETLENSIEEKLMDDYDYLSKLNMPAWELRNLIYSFIIQLENKNIGILNLTPEVFGVNDKEPILHEILIDVLIEHDKVYQRNLLDENKCSLGGLVSLAKELVESSWSRLDISKSSRPCFLFVDEFQDTDNSQIALLNAIRKQGNFKMFVVGDIKQCIYRFRGAEVDAFRQLGITEDEFNSFNLNKNYRTNPSLLNEFHKVFSSMGKTSKELLKYEEADKLLAGTKKSHNVIKGLRPLEVLEREKLGRIVFDEVQTLRDNLLTSDDFSKLSSEERTIAFLVRENWQAEELGSLATKEGFFELETVAGRGLFQSDPALDLLILLQALEGSRVEAFLELAQSNYFKLPIPKWKLNALNNVDAQQKMMESAVNRVLQSSAKPKMGFETWEHVLEATRTTPILQIIQILLEQLEPWKNYSNVELAQRFYAINANFLLEEVVHRIGLDSLTIVKLLRFMEVNLWSKGGVVECRIPSQTSSDVRILCTTVHKAKGLEYGHVILPYTNLTMDRINKKGLKVTIDQFDRIGYSYSGGQSRHCQNSFFEEKLEANELMKEEARILYVAMTRAMNSLSWVVNPKPPKDSWQTLLEGVQ